MKKLGERIASLINVKSIITLSLTAVFCSLSLDHSVSPEQFISIFTIIIGFYFGIQKEKKDNTPENDIDTETINLRKEQKNNVEYKWKKDKKIDSG